MYEDRKETGLSRIIGSSLVPSSRPFSPAAILAGCAASASSSLAMRTAAALAVQEQCRAMLAQTALQGVAALSSLEAHLQLVAPTGSERYRTILDAYSVALAMRMARG